jgi:hypothetical protein
VTISDDFGYFGIEQSSRVTISDLVRLFPIHMNWMGLEKILKKFDLFEI